MVRMTWGSPDDREHGYGLSNGVLYFKHAEPWNGLISVDSSEPGDTQAYYLDGQLRATLIATDNTEFSITAYTYPDNMPEVDGLGARRNTDEFGMSFKTLVRYGDGHPEHYRIHLVYNVVAAPASLDYTAVSDAVSPLNFVWEAQTRPIPIPRAKPTSYLLIESENTPSSVLERLEDILYGTSTQDARLPWPSEVMHLYAGFGFGYGHGNYGHGLYGYGLTI